MGRVGVRTSARGRIANCLFLKNKIHGSAVFGLIMYTNTS